MSETLQPVATVGPIAGLLEALERHHQTVPEARRGLGAELSELRTQLRANPQEEDSVLFQTRVAWLVQDWERHSGTNQAPPVSPFVARGLESVANEPPGLANPEMKALLKQAATLTDRGLVSDIRAQALNVAAMSPADQAGVAAVRITALLEGRLLQLGQMTQSPAPAPDQAHQTAPTVTTSPEPVSAGVTQAAPDDGPTAPSTETPRPDSLEGMPGRWEEAPMPAEEVPSTEAAFAVEPDAPAPAAGNGTSAEPDVAAKTKVEAGEPIRLDVPEKDAENARFVGAWQDPKSGQWFISAGSDPSSYEEWAISPESSQKAEDGVRESEQKSAETARKEPPSEPRDARTAEPNAEAAKQTASGPQVATRPAGAPRAGLGAAIGNMAAQLAHWNSEHRQSADDRRIRELAEKVTRTAREVQESAASMRAAAPSLFDEIDDTARRAGVTIASVIAGMATGKEYEALRKKFDDRITNDEVFAASYRKVGQSGRDMLKAMRSLGTEAANRNRLDTPEVRMGEQKAAEAAMKLDELPGEAHGKTLFDDIAKVAEMVAERLRGFFTALRGREKAPERDNGPSRGM